MRIDYFSRATIGCATLLAANTVQAAPPCVITPIESSPGEYIVELCETAKFSDLKNAIEFIIDPTHAIEGGWENAHVVIALPALSVFEFTETIWMDFGTAGVNNDIDENKTPKTISLRAPENATATFVNSINTPMHSDSSIYPRLFYAIRDGSFTEPDRNLRLENIRLHGNSGIPAETMSVPLPCEYDPTQETLFVRTGIRTKGLNVSLTNCILEQFASSKIVNTSSGTDSGDSVDGAALLIENGSVVLNACTLQHNFSGSEFIKDNGDCTLTNRGNGAAVAVINSSINTTIEILNSGLHMNTSSYRGGAIYIAGGPQNSEFYCANTYFGYNSVYGESATGGGAYITGVRLPESKDDQIPPSLFYECTFERNQTVDNSNTPQSQGGGLSLIASQVGLQDLEFLGNSATEGNDIYIEKESSSSSNPYMVRGCTFTNLDVPNSVSVHIQDNGSGLPWGTDECPIAPPVDTKIRFTESQWFLDGQHTYATRSQAASHTLDGCSISSTHNGPVIWVNNTVVKEDDTSTGPYTASVITTQCLIEGCQADSENLGFIRLTDNASSFNPLQDPTTISKHSRARVETTQHNYSHPILNQPALVVDDGTPIPECWITDETRICEQDLAPNGIVNGQDLALVLSYWGTSKADINCDGVTNGADLAELLASWGPCQYEP